MSRAAGGVDATVDTRMLRQALGTFATGVTVVTVGGDSPHGMTANAFTSVSLTPALVLICVDRNALMLDILQSSRGFGISILAHDQEHVARHFADRRRPLGIAQFADVGWQPGDLTGAPLIEDAVARFECRQWGTYVAGDHTIFVGELLSIDTSSEAEPLLFHRGKFGRTEPLALPTELAA